VNTNLRQFKTCAGCKAGVLSQGQPFSCALGFKVNGKTCVPLQACVKPRTITDLTEARKHNWESHRLLGYCSNDPTIVTGEDPALKQIYRIGLNAVEFGYRQCEKGNNLETALENFKAVTNSQQPCPNCASTTHPPGCCAKDGHGG